ncbi:roadblock/LC7 domain-containing protein [Micromonospora sp. HM5-17]|uniref:roadblock/LC7 domain-containing protein n=1 Tax=Micromonospora sp. HM5-17 TaxID=2487710 RepID=UPI000F472771|nr:roadblock/LC7 domain-containing protein [Micromonospora sp. HM5-17]ROT32371.1 roadblock/LC7 domain-containing protein [Micromonospora sp. HM5-17]
MVQTTRPASDLSWLLDDLVARVPSARQAVVLSADGLLMAASQGLGREDAEHMAAMASGFQSLAKGASRHFQAGPVRQTVVEMEDAFLFVTAAGQGACLAVLSSASADIGVIAYEMAMLVTRVGQNLSAPSRSPGAPSDAD